LDKKRKSQIMLSSSNNQYSRIREKFFPSAQYYGVIGWSIYDALV